MAGLGMNAWPGHTGLRGLASRRKEVFQCFWIQF